MGTELVGKVVREAAPIPVAAIGGINRDNITSVSKTGVSACAVISAILHSSNIANATRNLMKRAKSRSRT